MKYIRTKDDEVRTTIHLYKNEDGNYTNVDREIFCLPQIVSVKESDNIEELFDEYVMENKEHTYQTLLQSVGDIIPLYEGIVKDVKDEGTGSCEKYLQNGWEIYGAVIARGAHGEPILKPVAKMKKEGDWELL